MPAASKKTLPHGSILHAIYDAHNAGNRFIRLYDLEVNLGVSGWDLRSAVEDLKNAGYLNEDENGVFITDAGITVSRSRWV